jgi:hypothetical protein
MTTTIQKKKSERLSLKNLIREIELAKIYIETAIAPQTKIFEMLRAEGLLKVRKNGVLEDRSFLEGSPRVEEAFLIKDKILVDILREKGGGSMIWETPDHLDYKFYFYGRYNRGNIIFDDFVSRVILFCVCKNLGRDEANLITRIRQDIGHIGAYKTLPVDWTVQMMEAYKKNTYYNSSDWIPSIYGIKNMTLIVKAPNNEDYDNE